MTDHKLEVNEDGKASDSVGGAPAEPQQPSHKEFTVAAKAGLTKRGQHWPRGSKIELDPLTAERFINAGDVVDGDLPDEEDSGGK